MAHKNALRFSVSGKQVIKNLSKIGFVVTRQRGSHVRIEKHNGETIKITVPLHNELKKGTLFQILKTAGISMTEFIKLK